MKREQGFTLLEVILSVTIMTMVIATLYMAFAQATTAWRKQDLQTDAAKRLVVVSDMLSREFESLRPYTFNWEKGKDHFFSAGPTAMFYVTRQGFGADQRRDGGLYFACLYLSTPARVLAGGLQEGDIAGLEDEDHDSLALFLCKTNRPALWLLDEFHRYKNMNTLARQEYEPGLMVRDRSVFLVGGLDEARFSYSEGERIPFESNATLLQDDLLPNPADSPEFSLEDMDLANREWQSGGLPGLMQFALVHDEESVRLVRGTPKLPVKR